MEVLRPAQQAGRIVDAGDAAALSRIAYEPVGVCGLIAPWSYPLLQAAWKAPGPDQSQWRRHPRRPPPKAGTISKRRATGQKLSGRPRTVTDSQIRSAIRLSMAPPGVLMMERDYVERFRLVPRR
ncbi:aldehyde dehydrogenase family protein [Arthrobacter sp. NyZ413]